MKTKEEIEKWLLENCVDKDGNLNLIGLDFSNFDGDIYFRCIRVKNNLYQDMQEVFGKLEQDNQIVGGDLYQCKQEVKGTLYQCNQKVDGDLRQYNQKVKGHYYKKTKVKYN